jgi:hypothetical protein
MAGLDSGTKNLDKKEVERFIQQKFAEYAGLPAEEIFDGGTTLAMVLAHSPQMTNSIDLMETFARTSNALRKEYGVRVRLPALPLDTPMTTLVTLFLEEFARTQQGTAA